MSHLGLLKLMMLPSFCLRMLQAFIPLIFSRVGMSLRVLIGTLVPSPDVWTDAVLFVMRFLVLLVLVLVFMLACMPITGGTGGGAF